MNRKEAIAELKAYLGNVESDYDTKFNKALETGIKALENQKIGYWIDNAPEWQNIDPPYICSECGNAHLRKTDYCEQCGAKMEGE